MRGDFPPQLKQFVLWQRRCTSTTINKSQMPRYRQWFFFPAIAMWLQVCKKESPELLQSLRVKQTLPHIRSLPCTPGTKLSLLSHAKLLYPLIYMSAYKDNWRRAIVTRRITAKRHKNFSELWSHASSCWEQFFWRWWTDNKAIS